MALSFPQLGTQPWTYSEPSSRFDLTGSPSAPTSPSRHALPKGDILVLLTSEVRDEEETVTARSPLGRQDVLFDTYIAGTCGENTAGSMGAD
mmetsp:Transcript_2476/g.5888  ORF Transcript_2476/g.5888 Transcript_2476/m.5888 type:complete len:92 (+) Transcript_2476:813-1088(+)